MTDERISNEDSTQSLSEVFAKLGTTHQYEELPAEELPLFYERNLADTKFNKYLSKDPYLSKRHDDRNKLYKIINTEVFNRVIPMIQGVTKIHKMPFLRGETEETPLYIPMRLLTIKEHEYIDESLRLEKLRKPETLDNNVHWEALRLIKIISLSTSRSPFLTAEFFKYNKLDMQEQQSDRYLQESDIELLPKSHFVRLCELYNELEEDYNPDKLTEAEITELVRVLINGGNVLYDPKKLQRLIGTTLRERFAIILRLLNEIQSQEDNLQLAKYLSESETLNEANLPNNE